MVSDLTGMKKDDAVEALEKAGLILGNIGIVVSDGDKGTVINQDPPVGSNLGTGSKVDITINGE
nr:PASTA domain-containing protein [Butyrivibrio sp.]